MADQDDYSGQFFSDINMKVRDLEDKQRVMKDRLLLIGQNLVETKEKTSEKLLEIKRDLETLKEKMERLSSFIEMVSGEFSKFAKKEDLEILTKQAKMFQPLELMSKKDLERLKNI